MKLPRLLIVDDDRLTAVALAEMAAYAGYEVIGIAASVSAALFLAQLRPPDVALLDVRLAGAQDGIEGALLLRELYQLPVIFLSGIDDPVTRARAQQLDPVAFLAKPCSAEAMLDKLSHAVEGVRPASPYTGDTSPDYSQTPKMKPGSSSEATRERRSQEFSSSSKE